VKPTDISEERREYLKYKINELATHSKRKTMRELCRGAN
jgi:hypothetical protein